MQPNSLTQTPSVACVKAELRAVLESKFFRQAPKLASLLYYLCNKALLGESERVTEYTIAVDVFGKASSFKESKDSSVRVEAHRLRKRLAEFYDSEEGRDRPLRIVIPPGRYAPEFVSIKPSESVVPELVATLPAVDSPAHAVPAHAVLAPPSRKRAKLRLYLALPAALSLIVVAAFFGAKSLSRLSEKSALPQEASPAGTKSPPVSAAGAGQAVRIMAGYSGPPHYDTSGIEWGPDRFFTGGRPSRTGGTHISRTNDPFLFESARIGDFSYHVPLPPGVYEIHLYFVESQYGPEVGGGENDRTFFLHINNQRLTPAIDIESDAMGPNIADERVFKDIRPAADGKLHLLFESGTGVPLLNAIAILPGTPGKQLPTRLVTHNVPFTDHSGQIWKADNYYLNGHTCPRNAVVQGTPDAGIFTSERYGHFSYAIPVDVKGSYAVGLHFAELYFGPSLPGRGGTGNRVFNVACNGRMLLENMDIYKDAGSGRALTKWVHHLRSSAQGKLNLTFEPVVNYALIYGIEVLDESE